MRVGIAVDAECELGECPVWCDLSDALYWTDIDGRTLHCWRPEDGAHETWAMPSSLGSFALCRDGRTVLLGLGQEVALYDLLQRKMLSSAAVPERADGLRINDGACDTQGRFVFGMFNPREERIGAFWRAGPGLALERLPLPAAAIGNSIAFSPNGETMYFTDSPTRTIFRVAYGADGSVGEPERWVTVPGDGVPDGSAIDAEGGLWNAQWGGSQVLRYGSSGTVTDRIALSAEQVTSIAFGGKDFSQIFITSAGKGQSPESRALQKGGAVFVAHDTGHRGLPVRRFSPRNEIR